MAKRSDDTAFVRRVAIDSSAALPGRQKRRGASLPAAVQNGHRGSRPRCPESCRGILPMLPAGAKLDKIRESLITERHRGVLMDLPVTHTGSFTLYGVIRQL